MSLLVSILVAFSFFVLFNTIFGGSSSSSNESSNTETDKDIARLREIAEYDRWENKK